MSTYVHHTKVHNTRAANVVVPLLLKHVHPRSVLDIGCGTGTWLKVFEQNGITDFLGVDGEDIPPNALHIPEKNFAICDITHPLDIDREFDLVVSLEVAEHLPESAADQFIKTLVKHSKVILFSAAIPGQGGQNHLNEQWPVYWREKFRKYGYRYYDLIRPEIWDREEVDVWYRQNMFLVCHESANITSEEFTNSNLIHPKFWERKVNNEQKLNEQIENWREGKIGIVNSSKSLGKSFKKVFTNPSK